MRDDGMRRVRYDWYCIRCKHWVLDDDESPCRECLDEPTRLGSEEPHKFEKE